MILFSSKEIKSNEIEKVNRLSLLYIENSEFEAGDSIKYYFENIIPLNYRIETGVKIDKNFDDIIASIRKMHLGFVKPYLRKKNFDYMVYFYLPEPGGENFVVCLWNREGIQITEYLPYCPDNKERIKKVLPNLIFNMVHRSGMKLIDQRYL